MQWCGPASRCDGCGVVWRTTMQSASVDTAARSMARRALAEVVAASNCVSGRTCVGLVAQVAGSSEARRVAPGRRVCLSGCVVQYAPSDGSVWSGP